VVDVRPTTNATLHGLMLAFVFVLQNADADAREGSGMPVRKSRRTAARAALVGLASLSLPCIVMLSPVTGAGYLAQAG
jgi:hypothetical protein